MKCKIEPGDMVVSDDWVDIVYQVVGDVVHMLCTKTDELSSDKGTTILYEIRLEFLSKVLEGSSKILLVKSQQ